MKKVLITGSKGQLGHDCARLLEVSYSLVLTDIDQVDLSVESDAHRFLSECDPAIIINCAAFTAVDACETEPDCWKANHDLPAHLASWAVERDRMLIHISTDYVFDGMKPLFMSSKEIDLPHPISEYGRSKLAGEQAIIDSGVHYAILRTAWLYGIKGTNFIKTMLRLTIQQPEKTLRVVDDQYGSPTWSRTLAEQIQVVMENEAKGLFHASSEQYTSWYEFAVAFMDEMQISHRIEPCSSVEYPTPTERPKNSILENEKLKEIDMNVFRDWKYDLGIFVKENREQLMQEVKS